MTSTHPRRRGELSGQAGPEGWAVYEPETDSVHVLNETARAIWEVCDGNTSAEEMANAIAELTKLDAEQSAAEVTAALDRLYELGLVEL